MEALKEFGELLVTIDTEPDCDPHWKRSNPLTFTSITDGIPKFFRPIWNKFNIRPIYFVSPEILTHQESCRVLESELDKGAVLGTHLHSEYIAPAITITNPAGIASLEYPCFAHSQEVEYEKIARLTEALEKRFLHRPIWYRAARYGADLDTVKSLHALGYQFDSSVTPGISWSKQGGPDHSSAPRQPYWIAKDNFYRAVPRQEGIGIVEVPITIGSKRGGPVAPLMPDHWMLYEWLRPTHMSIWEQQKLIKKFRAEFAHPTLVLMFHSMEVMPNKTPYVRNAWMQNRFLRNLESVIKFAKEKE